MSQDGGTDKQIELTLARCLRWLGADLTRFSEDYWRHDEVRSQFPFGPLLELLQLISVVDIATAARNIDIEELTSIGGKTFDVIRNDDSAAGYSLLGKSLTDSVRLRAGMRPGPPAVPSASDRSIAIRNVASVLDRVYIADHLGYLTDQGIYGRMISDHAEKTRQRHGLAEVDAYIATHIVLYASAFGSRELPLNGPGWRQAKNMLDDVSAAAHRASNVDISAEAEASRLILNHGDTASAGALHLIDIVSRQGFLSSAQAVSASPDDEFRSAYHPTIAFCIYASNRLESSSRPS